MKNRLVCIGFLGHMECYLNLTVEEARERFTNEFYGNTERADPDEYTTYVFEFDDRFAAYDIWPTEK